MKYELKVVDIGGVLHFYHKGETFARRFLSIPAFGEFEGGVLEVSRNGEVVAKSTSIHSVGTHGPTTVFDGIESIFNDKAVPLYLDVLTAGSLEAGDQVTIESTRMTADGFFARYLQRQPQTTLDI